METASIAVGNVFSLLFIIFLISSTMASQKSAESLCSSASVFIVMGQFILTMAFATKIQKALILRNIKKESRDFQRFQTAVSGMYNKTVVSKCSSILEQPPSSLSGRMSKAKKHIDLEGKKTGTVILMVLLIMVAIVTVLWFSLVPFSVREIKLGQSHSPNHRSIVNVYFTEACQLSLNSLTSQILFAIIMSVYGILQLRLIQLSIFARKVGPKVMADIVYVKIATGISISVIFLGGIVIWLFYSANTSTLFMAVSTIDLIISATNSICLLKSLILIIRPTITDNIF